MSHYSGKRCMENRWCLTTVLAANTVWAEILAWILNWWFGEHLPYRKISLYFLFNVSNVLTDWTGMRSSKKQSTVSRCTEPHPAVQSSDLWLSVISLFRRKEVKIHAVEIIVTLCYLHGECSQLLHFLLLHWNKPPSCFTWKSNHRPVSHERVSLICRPMR